jgi:hypothetical protein
MIYPADRDGWIGLIMHIDGLITFKTIEDNKSGIETMIKNDMDCVDVIRQSPAVHFRSDG